MPWFTPARRRGRRRRCRLAPRTKKSFEKVTGVFRSWRRCRLSASCSSASHLAGGIGFEFHIRCGTVVRHLHDGIWRIARAFFIRAFTIHPGIAKANCLDALEWIIFMGGLEPGHWHIEVAV